MPLTRAGLEAAVLLQVGGPWADCGFDLTISGTNASLDGPLTWAAARCGLTLADPVTLTDADLANLPASASPKMIDFAVYRALWACLVNNPEVNYSSLTESQSLDQKRQALKVALDMQGEHLKAAYGFGRAGLTTGSFRVGFASGCRRRPEL